MKLKTISHEGHNIEVDVYSNGMFSAYVFGKSFNRYSMESAVNDAKEYVELYIKDEIISFDDLVNLTLGLVWCSEGGNVEGIDEDGFKVIIDKYIKSSNCV